MMAGHRAYVGGAWDEIGSLQFSYLVSEGLRLGDGLIDVACGALRGGIHFIPYLDFGKYYGIEKEGELIRRGLRHELPPDVREEKSPNFVVSSEFEFSKFEFDKPPRFSIAQSLFTHLNREDCVTCLTNLREVVDVGHRFYVTILEGDSSQSPKKSHSHRGTFFYSQAELKAMAEGCGWEFHYVGDWEHPRGQMMTKFVAI